MTVLEGAAVGVTSSSLVPLTLVVQPAADASLRVSLNLGGQSRQVLDSQGRRNYGDLQAAKGPVKCHERLGGLLTYYYREAA